MENSLFRFHRPRAVAPRDGDRIETTIDLGARTAPLIARVNARARRFIVRVDTAGGRVLVTAPSRRALNRAIDFAHSRRAWILARFEEAPAGRPFAPGGVVPYRGAPHRIALDGPARAGVRLRDGDPPEIAVGGEAAHVNRRLVDWLKREARGAFAERADHYAALLGKKRGPIRIRDTRSRWGSCSSEGELSFSWRLILAPPEMLDYVAAHECAHLVRLDHSPAYWRVLASLGVDREAARAWFAQHGEALHSYGRGAP